MDKNPAAEDIRVDEKFPPGTINRSEPTGPERLRDTDQQVQQSNMNEAAPRAAPPRRPLFRT